MPPIYLDHAATTPLRPEVRAAMEPFLSEEYANPSSVYRLAQRARSALDRARDTVAGCLGAKPSEIIFTSGGTESDNAAIKGVALARRAVKRHVITSAIEHHAVLHPVEELAELFGFEITALPVSPEGMVDPDTLRDALRTDTALVTIMWANNEIGTIQPIEEIAAITREHGVPLHVDAVQVAGVLPIDLRRLPIDLLSLSAHKFYGPKGAGVLYLRSGTPWLPFITGGGQERNRRAGTENVSGIAGLATALELACQSETTTAGHLRALQRFLIDEIELRIPGAHLNGDRQARLPNNVNISIPGAHGESLLVGLDLAGIMASSGSACTSGSLEPSHVLQALGLPHELAQASLRFTMGRETTRRELDRTVEVLEALVARTRRLAPAWEGG